MENLQDKISKALEKYSVEEHDNNRSATARALGLANSVTLNHWINKTRAPGVDALQTVFDVLGWQLVLPGEELRNYSLIPKTAAKAGAGSSYEVEDEMAGLYAFRSDYLGRRHISERNSVLVEVSGDSMEPTLRSGDTILVDKSDREVMDGHIYLVGFQGQLLVKRVSRTVTGLRLKSDNPHFSDIDIPKEYTDDFVVHGRMRWMCRDC